MDIVALWASELHSALRGTSFKNCDVQLAFDTQLCYDAPGDFWVELCKNKLTLVWVWLPSAQ